MRSTELLDRAYERFLTLEGDEWGSGEVAAIRRYTWTVWYKPSRVQFARLVADCLANEGEYAGGVPHLHRKVMSSLENLGDVEQLLPRIQHAAPRPIPLVEANPGLGQIVCDAGSRHRVAQQVWQDFPYGARIGILGDDDLVGLVVADENYPVVVFDVDERLGNVFDPHPHAEFRHHDIRRTLAGEERFDAVLLDPADGSVALSHWLERLNECLSQQDGARAYLSVNLWRLGRRWSRVVEQCMRYNLVPCDVKLRAKNYPLRGNLSVMTDLWVFERTSIPSALPRPYLDIEVFR